MAFTINNNASALKANMYLNNANKNLENTLAKLAAGIATANAASDASGLAIADGMSSQVAGYGQAMMNINDAIGVTQVTDGALSGINDNLSRIRELTLQASNGVLDDTQRGAIQKEIDQLLQANDSIVSDTKFNDQTLLDGNGSFTFQTGANSGDTQTVSIADSSSSVILGGGIDVTSQSSLATALESIDGAMAKVADNRANLGAAQNSLESTFRNVSLSQVNIAAAESQIKDVDFALESMNFSQQNLLAQSGSFAAAQSNAVSASITGLLK